MTAFAVYDSERDVDLSEHGSLAAAYKEIERLKQKRGNDCSLAVRLASHHRRNLEEQATTRRLSFV